LASFGRAPVDIPTASGAFVRPALIYGNNIQFFRAVVSLSSNAISACTFFNPIWEAAPAFD